MVVAGQHHVRTAQPFLLQCGQFDLDHHHPEPLAAFLDRLGQVVAGHAGGHADAVEASTALGQGLAVIGPVAVVLANVAGRLVPVAGGHRHAIVADQGQCGRAGDFVGALQLEVQPLPFGGEGHAQRLQQVRIQREHLRQGAETVDALLQALAIQLQLALHLGAFTGQRLAPRIVAGCNRAQHGATDHHQQGQQQHPVASEPVHGGSLRRAGGRGTPPGSDVEGVRSASARAVRRSPACCARHDGWRRPSRSWPGT